MATILICDALTGQVKTSFPSAELEAYLKSIKKDDKFEVQIKEDNFEPIAIGDYVKLANDSTPIPDPTPTGLKYDSNIQGNMNNGVARFVTDREGNIKADGCGFTVNASGGGGIRCLGNGQFNIEPATVGNRRMYIACCNYNARIEGEFSFLDSKPDNLSIKGRNRHQYRDEVDSSAPDSKTQGGLGFHISIGSQEVGGKVEVVHGKTEIDSWTSKLSKNLVVGQWYGFKVSYKDRSSTEVDEKIELDYKDGQGFKTVGTHIAKPTSVFFNKSDFDTWSQFWLRDNNEGKIGLRNVKLYSI
jgi:hypothetical protein